MIQKIAHDCLRVARLQQKLNKLNDLPPFLYHLTSESAAKKIVESGFIKTSTDGCYSKNANCLKGVFTFDYLNLDQWLKRADWNGDLALSLIKQASKGDDRVVLFKIPTQTLNPDDVRFRSQNILFNKMRSLDKNMNSDHRISGDTSDMAEFYTKNHALEYICQKEIPVSSKNIVGTASARETREQLPQHATARDWVTIAFKKLFEKEPKERSVIDEIFKRSCTFE